MHEPLVGLLERAELAIAASRTVVAPEVLDPISRVMADARTRLLYPEEVLVAALAGGTGSGKSSLFNLLTGSEEAGVGVARPTTSEALAAVPAGYPHALDTFLDEIGVRRRITQDRIEGVCLIDLPDTDSVETDHRLRVEAILPRLDVLVWVVDPEKYRDAALHHRYLQPLSDYANQFVVVFNQIDRLGPTAVDQVVDDLRGALAEDGLVDVEVIRASAFPPSGPPIGIDAIAGTLTGMAGKRSLLYSKLLVDLDRSASDLAAAVGGPVGYREESKEALDAAVRHLGAGEAGEAVDILSDFVNGVAERAGGPTGATIRRIANTIPEKVHEIGSALPEPPVRRWWGRRQDNVVERSELARVGLADLLNPVEELIAVRARAAALTADFALAVAQLRPPKPRT